MKITVLDAATLGEDVDLSDFSKFGETEIFKLSSPEEVGERIKNTDIAVLNKIKINRQTVPDTGKLKLICISATGYDNIDLSYCREKNIAVCNVAAYSTDSVAQVTVATVLSLYTHLGEYNDYTKSGKYSRSGVANRLLPVYREIAGKTWGIVGCGNIGQKVKKIAEALGCNVLVNRRSTECTSLSELCVKSDIITVHTPLTEETRGLIGEDEISKMKKDVVLVNEARGAVVDEEAVCRAILEKRIGAFGADVFSVEPYPENHCYHKLSGCENVILTPHMAWGAFEARQRCVDEMVKNTESFLKGEKRNRL